ncbi:MAG: helix-turn-helix domain-containing protein [Haloferacaceae archaeon]
MQATIHGETEGRGYGLNRARDVDSSELLTALGDDTCRAVLEATDGAALTANEIADACDLSLSTTYRKLQTLTDLYLLEEQTRLRGNGRHVSEFVCRVESVDVGLTNGFEVDMTVAAAD